MFVVPIPSNRNLPVCLHGEGEGRARIPALARASPSEEQEAEDLIIICLRLPGDTMVTKSGIQAEPDLVRPGGHKVGAALEEGGWRMV